MTASSAARRVNASEQSALEGSLKSATRTCRGVNNTRRKQRGGGDEESSKDDICLVSTIIQGKGEGRMTSITGKRCNGSAQTGTSERGAFSFRIHHVTHDNSRYTKLLLHDEHQSPTNDQLPLGLTLKTT